MPATCTVLFTEYTCQSIGLIRVENESIESDAWKFNASQSEQFRCCVSIFYIGFGAMWPAINSRTIVGQRAAVSI